MSIVFNGISEGTFAFFIIFCTLVGMATGAYLMDRNRFIELVKSKTESTRGTILSVAQRIKP